MIISSDHWMKINIDIWLKSVLIIGYISVVVTKLCKIYLYCKGYRYYTKEVATEVPPASLPPPLSSWLGVPAAWGCFGGRVAPLALWSSSSFSSEPL